MKAKHILAASIALALVGCGNTSDDKPDAPAPPPVPEFNPSIEGYSHASGIDLEQLAGMNGQDLLDGIQTQLNNNLNERSDGTFTVTPMWGFGVNGWDVANVEIVQDEAGTYVIQTTFPQGVSGKPHQDNVMVNGFKFLVDFPDGTVKEAAIAYKFKSEFNFGSQDDRSPDYIFTPGLTSGDVEPANAATIEGTGFTYKFSTDKYGYYNTRFADALDNKFFNQQILVNGTPPRLAKDVWNHVQLNLTVNDLGLNNGKVEYFYNGEKGVAKVNGETVDRVIVDGKHEYKLQATVEAFRHTKHGSDDESNLKEHTFQITDLVIGWNLKN